MKWNEMLKCTKHNNNHLLDKIVIEIVIIITIIMGTKVKEINSIDDQSNNYFKTWLYLLFTFE